MTRQYSDSIALAARRIVAASAVDITEPVAILPLAKQLMQETGCGIDAAKRHVAKAIRLARGELTTSPTWGGKRQPAGGRPKTMTATIDYANNEMQLIDAAGNVLHSVNYWPNSAKSVAEAEAALLAWAKARNITVN